MGAIAVSSGMTINTERDRFVREGVLTLSTSYAAAGDTYTARQFGLGIVDNLDVGFGSAGGTSGAFGFVHDKANLKILAIAPGASSSSTAGSIAAGFREATAGTNLSTVPVRFRATGV